ncbi:MAG: sensor histidine kinase, partial [Actinobacteria bacterium]|nr:sensor histidine kinase [Actinomycetota bacterium]
SGKFFYDMHIPSNLKKVKIPKLSIQPLVENAIKYMGKVSPPWRISLKGWYSESGFRINVSDNGGGFSKEELERINKKMKLFDENNTLPSLKLDGMGILNIYIRLKLSYNDMAYFTLENTIAGASITFGADRLSNN